jgi:hypothetical protein
VPSSLSDCLADGPPEEQERLHPLAFFKPLSGSCEPWAKHRHSYGKLIPDGTLVASFLFLHPLPDGPLSRHPPKIVAAGLYATSQLPCRYIPNELYYKLHGSARPISIKSGVVRKRCRHDSWQGGNSSETPSASPGVSRQASPARGSSSTLVPDSTMQIYGYYKDIEYSCTLTTLASSRSLNCSTKARWMPPSAAVRSLYRFPFLSHTLLITSFAHQCCLSILRPRYQI